MNLSFSFILQHRETGEFRYHYASNNNQILSSPRLIRNQKDLENLLDHLAAKDFPSHLKDQRPNIKWIIERIVSLRIHLVMTTYPLGNPPKLPDYIKNNRFIIGLEKDQNHNYHIINLEKPIITVIKKLKNFLINIVNISKSNFKILKA